MSISLPLFILFIPYIIFLLVFAFYAFFNLFQLFKHGLNTIKTRVLGLIFIAVVGMILFVTYEYAQGINWNSALTFDSFSTN